MQQHYNYYQCGELNFRDQSSLKRFKTWSLMTCTKKRCTLSWMSHGCQSKTCHFNTAEVSESWLFFNFCTFWWLKLTKWTKFTTPKMPKMAVFALLESPKLISRKFRVIEKSLLFHTVQMYLKRPHFRNAKNQEYKVKGRLNHLI